MKTALVRIGNEQAVRLPQEIIQQWGLVDTVEIIVKDNKVIISPVSQSRQGWENTFREMAENGDDELLIDDTIPHSWDESEWQW